MNVVASLVARLATALMFHITAGCWLALASQQQQAAACYPLWQAAAAAAAT
jgi:hypothetical protein